MTFKEAKNGIILILGKAWKPPTESAKLAQAARDEAARRDDLDVIDKRMVASLAEAAELAWNHNGLAGEGSAKRAKAEINTKLGDMFS